MSIQDRIQNYFKKYKSENNVFFVLESVRIKCQRPMIHNHLNSNCQERQSEIFRKGVKILLYDDINFMQT